MLPVGFPGAAFSAWRERFAAGVPFWKNGLVLSHPNLKPVTQWRAFLLPKEKEVSLVGQPLSYSIDLFFAFEVALKQIRVTN